MTIKFGELTIIHDNDNDNFDIFSTLKLLFGRELDKTENSKAVLLFEDGLICEIDKDKIEDFNFKFIEDEYSTFPFYFKKNKEDKHHIYFKRKPKIREDGTLGLNFNNLFRSYNKFIKNMLMPSKFNVIYYSNKIEGEKELFGIIRAKSSETMPRFLIAYESEEFTKEEIKYIINYIFSL
jgi:hypothetical protein